ncbi:hypothetical protein [Frankia sp. CcWB3]
MTSADRHDPEVGQWWKTLAEEGSPVDLRTDQPHAARMYGATRCCTS